MGTSTDPDTPAAGAAHLGPLERAEDRYPRTTVRIPEAIVVLDPRQGRFVTVDAEAELLFGMDRERLTTVGPLDVSPPEQPDGRPSDAAMAGYIDRAVRGETPAFRWTFLRGDGSDVAREVRLRTLPGPDGGTLVLGSLVDVTQRDTPQERLESWDAREAKDRHAAFIASLHDGFEMMDRNGMILDVNERFAEIVGMPRDEIIGLRPPFPWWFPEGPERTRVEDALQSLIRGGSGEFDFTFRRPDGGTVDVILNANEVVGSDGDRLGLVAIVKDVSDRVAAQAERDELMASLAEERSQLGKVLQRLSRLQGFTASIAERMTQAEVIESLMSAAREAVRASGAAVILLTDDDVLAVVATDGELDPDMIPATSSPAVAGDIQEAFRTGRARWLEPRPRGEGAPDDRWGFIPLVRRGGSMGVLAICCPETTFTPEDRATLETMVWQASQALERARLLESEARSRQMLARVLTVSDAALEWLDSDDALRSLLQRIREAVGADSASLLVLEGDTLHVRATDGLGRIPEEQVPIPLGKGFSGRIAAERTPVVVEDVSRVEVVSPWLRERLRSVAGVPIFRADGVVGVLHVGSTSQRSFDGGDIELLELVAARVGGALERARLFDSARAARADAARAADRLRRLQTATAALTGAMTVQDVSGAILNQAVAVVRGDAGVLVLPSKDGRFLEVVATTGEPETLGGVGGHPDRFRIEDDTAICEAYRSGSPVWVPSRREWERRFADGFVTTDPTARSILAVPMRIDDQRLGGIGLLFEAEGRLSKGERRLATTFAEQAALALERARLFEAERAARDTTERLQALAASLAVVATAKEVLTILVEDGSAIVGAASAWAAVLDRGAQELHAVAWRGYDSELIDPFQTLSLDLQLPATDAVRERREIWFDSLEGFDRAYTGFDRPSEEHGGGFGCLPMFDTARRPIGVVSLQLAPRGTIGERERSALRAIVALGAQALERAQLYELEHAVAATLQKSLLPGSLPADPRVSIATRYRPGTEELDVGGDWYDVIRIGDDRIGVAIGDVVGHGLEAASAMGQLRSALRGLALTGHGPGSVIEGLDRFAQTSGPATMATVAYAELDLTTNELRYGCAGHPPPVIQIAGEIRFLERGRTTPLAALPDPIRCDEETEAFPPGSVLVLYSDGLIERRGEQLDMGMARLRDVLRDAPSGHPEALADLLLAELIGEVPQDDDVAVLCLRAAPDAPPLVISMPAEPAALADVRASVRRWLVEVPLSDEAREEVVLACNEACANAVEHAYLEGLAAPIRVSLVRDATDIKIEIVDEGAWRQDGAGADRGRGMPLMRALMDEVGVRPSSDGTVVTMRRRISEP
ncbi:MAG: GAF domain-containing protein [Actinomycetota bacterium]|nr:GAF domain-containing protein [Actinomycetota bacterium]